MIQALVISLVLSISQSTNVSTSKTFQCSNFFTLSLSMLCDGYSDCLNGRDEALCDRAQCEFKCKNDQCTLNRNRCDGIYNCLDGSDEISCKPEATKQTCTSKTQFKCASSNECIPLAKLCDCTRDCQDDSDEWPVHCKSKKCSSSQFKCEWNGSCLSLNRTCDGIDDCGDNSDETACLNDTLISSTSIHCVFRCKSNNVCLNEAQLCNHFNDCPYGEDESICNFTLCSNRLSLCGNDRNAICRVKPLNTYECLCADGFLFDRETKICRDINECDHSTCPQICINTIGSYMCECFYGYHLKHGHCLLSNETDLYSNELEFLFVDHTRMFLYDYQLNFTELVLKFDYAISDFDFFYDQDVIVFYVKSTNSIYLEYQGNISTLFNLAEYFGEYDGHVSVNLAFDWANFNIYFTKNSSLYILGPIKSPFESIICKMLLHGLLEVRSLVVSPTNKRLFWIDLAFGSIESSSLDGANHQILLKDLNHPHGLIIDAITNRLYWFESKHDGLFTCDLNGNNMFLVASKVPQKPLEMSAYNGAIYFLFDNKINKLNVSTNFKKTLIKKDINRLIQINGSNKIRIANKLSQSSSKTLCNCGPCLCLIHTTNNHSCICDKSIEYSTIWQVLPNQEQLKTKNLSSYIVAASIFLVILVATSITIKICINYQYNRQKSLKCRAIYKCKFIKKEDASDAETEIGPKELNSKSLVTSTYSLNNFEENIYETSNIV